MTIILSDDKVKQLIEYIYDFGWHYGRFYHIGDADKIKAAIRERFQLPEEYFKNNSTEHDATCIRCSKTGIESEWHKIGRERETGYDGDPICDECYSELMGHDEQTAPAVKDVSDTDVGDIDFAVLLPLSEENKKLKAEIERLKDENTKTWQTLKLIQRVYPDKIKELEEGLVDLSKSKIKY